MKKRYRVIAIGPSQTVAVTRTWTRKGALKKMSHYPQPTKREGGLWAFRIEKAA